MVSGQALAQLAPGGRLRAGINHGNFLLVAKDSPHGAPRGIAPDLALEIGKRLGVPVEFVSYDAAGGTADGAAKGEWDVAFLGAEPERANEILFTDAYLEIPVTFLVPAGSAIRAMDEVDRAGVRIALPARAAFDLYLGRNFRHATLVRAEGIEGSVRLFVEHKLDALAGLRPRLEKAVQEIHGSRILEGQVTAVQQAIGTPRGREVGAAYLREFAEDAKRSGLVARLIEKHGVRGVSVAP